MKPNWNPARSTIRHVRREVLISSSRYTLQPDADTRFTTGYVIIVQHTRFVLRSMSGERKLFELAPSCLFDPEDLQHVVRRGSCMTVEYRANALEKIQLAVRVYRGSA